jgi:hypothetical protein
VIFPQSLALGERWRRAFIVGKRTGTWHFIFSQLRELTDARGLIDWDMHCVDSTIIRAHQHAAGGKKGLVARSDARFLVVFAGSAASNGWLKSPGMSVAA